MVYEDWDYQVAPHMMDWVPFSTNTKDAYSHNLHVTKEVHGGSGSTRRSSFYKGDTVNVEMLIFLLRIRVLDIGVLLAMEAEHTIQVFLLIHK